MTLEELTMELDILILDAKIQITQCVDNGLIEDLEYRLLVLNEIQEQLYRLQDLIQ